MVIIDNDVTGKFLSDDPSPDRAFYTAVKRAILTTGKGEDSITMAVSAELLREYCGERNLRGDGRPEVDERGERQFLERRKKGFRKLRPGEEPVKLPEMVKFVNQARQLGAVHDVGDISSEEAEFIRHPHLTAKTDWHILALGKASGCRLLCSEDAALIRDWQNPKLLDQPRDVSSALMGRPKRADERRTKPNLNLLKKHSRKRDR